MFMIIIIRIYTVYGSNGAFIHTHENAHETFLFQNEKNKIWEKFHLLLKIILHI